MQTCCNDFVLLVAVSPLADNSNYVQHGHFTSVTIINVDVGISYIKSNVQSALQVIAIRYYVCPNHQLQTLTS